MKYAVVICIQIYLFTYGDKLHSQTEFWEQTSGPTNGNIQKLIVNSNDYLFAINKFLGVFRSTDNGANWTTVNRGITDLDIRSLAVNVNGYLFAGGARGVFRSSDEGASWTAVNAGLPYPVYDLAVNSSGHLFAATGGSLGTGGVFRSTDNGESWENIGLKDTLIWNIAVNDSSGYLFAGTFWGEGVFRSTNNGASWVPINSGLPANCATHSIVSKPNGDLYVIIACDGNIYRSIDNGDTWNLIKTCDATFAFIQSLAFNATGHIFIGTAGNGVFRSTDNGSQWTSTGLMGKVVPSLVVNSVGILFAGTYGDGVFRSTQTTVDVNLTENQLSSAFMLEQNYPNPFNLTTIIGYNLPKDTRVKIVVFDLLGRVIKTLVDQEKSTGTYKLKFEANNLSSGVYFYQLQTTEFSQTRKFILMR